MTLEPRAQIAKEMAELAVDFLSSLDGEQEKLAAWPFPSNGERERWFYTPTDHGGVTLGSLTSTQERKALHFVASGLSVAGYVTVATIIGLDNILDQVEGWKINWGRERGRDPGLYYLRVFGTPGDTGSWSWRFGGHHVSIQHTIVDGLIVASTPCFLGADPASSPLLGSAPLRPLAGPEDLAHDVVLSLTDEQLHRALLSPNAPTDLVTTNRAVIEEGETPLHLKHIWRDVFDGELLDLVDTIQINADKAAGLTPADLAALSYTTAPKGIFVKDFDSNQREAIRSLLDTYLYRVPDALAELEAAKYEGDKINELAFAWAGSTQPGQPHYYRMQAPQLLVEYDNTQRAANHVHTLWRNPDNDFGRDILAEHIAKHH
jgi:hypothetical protein